MSTDAKRKNLLDKLLGSPEPFSSPTLDELYRMVHRSFNVAEQPSVRTSAPTVSAGAVSKGAKPATKRKATLYLSENIFHGLESAKHSIRKMLPSGLHSFISKSSIANVALKLLLKEYEKRGEDSILLKQLVREADNCATGMRSKGRKNAPPDPEAC